MVKKVNPPDCMNHCSKQAAVQLFSFEDTSSDHLNLMFASDSLVVRTFPALNGSSVMLVDLG